MVVTEVKIKLVPRSDDKLLAFASITLDRCFVVRDIKVIQGSKALFVAMPSRKITDRCTKCGAKNHLQALYCNQCGVKLAENRTRPDDRGRAKLHADIAHPINVKCRQEIQDAILKGYQQELERSRLPGYVPQQMDEYDAGPEDFEVNIPSPTPVHGVPSVTGSGSNPNADAVKEEKTPSSAKSPRVDNSGFGILG